MSSAQIALDMARSCDICGSRASELLYAQRFAQFDDQSSFAGYDVVACHACGFVYADGIPEQEAFDRYYREMSKYESHSSDGTAPEAALANYRAIVTEISEHLPDRAMRILDVGAASGDLLAAFRVAGYHDVLGLEASPRCSELALERHDIRVVNTPISAMRLDGKRFDLILLSSVLEHLPNLIPTVRELVSLLTPGGAIWFEVPDASRFADAPEAPFQEFSLEHINYFTAASLRTLMSRVGYRSSAMWTAERRLGGIVGPVVDGLFVADPAAVTRPLSVDQDGPVLIRRYIDLSNEIEDMLFARIAPLIAAATPVVVWGIGSLALHLFANERFAGLRIKAFADSNTNYQGKRVAGIPVISPDALADRDETILIVSRTYEAEIAATISKRFGPTRRVVGLFGVAQGRLSTGRR